MSEQSNGLQIADAFIVLGNKPILVGAPSSALCDSYIITLGYVPRWARRRRLRFLRPTLTRLLLLPRVWAWTRGRDGSPIAIQYGPTS